MVAKGDIVVARGAYAFAGKGFVHYVLHGGMALVEFPVAGKAFIYTTDLTTVDLPINEGWAAPSNINHNGRE